MLSMTCSFAKNSNITLCLPNENIIDTVADSALHRDLLANGVNATFCRKRQHL